MGKGTIGGKIVLEGEKRYRDALKSIKSGQAELRSEMKLCASQFKESQNTLEALSKKHEILTKQVDTQKQKIDVYRDAMAAWNKAGEDAAQKTEDLKTALEVAEKGMKEMSGASEDNAQAVEEQKKKIGELKEKLVLAEEMCTKAAQKTQSYATAANNAQVELNNMESELNKTTKQMQEAEKNTDKCATSIDKYGQETEVATEKINIFGDVLKANLASEVIISGVKALADGIKQAAESAVDVGSSFEAAMSEVAATMGMTADEINAGSEDYTKLADAAKACGAVTKFSASEAAEALNYLALAGYDVDKSVATLPKVLDLAAAGGLDLAYASDLVTDSMAALSIETSELDNYIDEMAKTSQKSNTNVAQLGEATLVCAGTVSLTSQKLETMNTELGVLANNGIKGSEGGTHLRNVLLSLSAPTDTAALAISSLGLKVHDSSGNMRDLNDILIDMNRSMSSMTQAEKTQMISTIFNKTDIAAVNALLKGTGDEYDNLFEQINNCSGAAANMAETMNNNLKGDVVILQSALEGLGIASYEVFDDTMRKSVQAATDAVGRLTKGIDKGNLGVSLNKMSSALGDFCDKAIDVGEDALPVVIDGFTWLLDNSDLVISGIVGITAANMEMKVVAPAIETVTAAWGAYKQANEGATVTQWLLNTAMSANPAGILLTTITALTAGVAAYCIINKDNLTQMSEQSQATMDLIDQTRALNDETKRSLDTARQSVTDIESQGKVAKNLAGELEDLRNKTSLTTDEQTRMKMIVDELNTIVPDLNLHYDEQNNTLNMTQKEIEGCVESYMELYRAQAVQEELMDIAERQVEYEKQLYDLGEQRKAQQQELEDATEALTEATANETEIFESNGASLSGAQMRAAEAAQALAELDATIKETEESNRALSDEYEYWKEVVGDNDPLNGATTATGDLGNAAQTTSGQVSDMGATVSQAYQDMVESVSETVGKQIELFAQFNGEAELTVNELLGNMKSQVDGITQWADNMEELGQRGIDQGLLQHLADLGPQGAGYVATFVEMTEEQLQEANELWEESLKLSGDSAAKVAEGYEEAGKNAAEGFKTGISGSAEDVAVAAEDMAQGTLDATMKKLDEHSPSKEFEAIGDNVDQGMILGIKGSQQDVINAIEALCSAMISKGQNCVTQSRWSEIGRRIPEGMKAGIEAGTSSVVAAVENMAAKAVQAAKDKLQIHSPSREFFYMGQMSGEGYKNGLKASMANVNALIEATMPDRSMMLKSVSVSPQKSTGDTSIYQEINVYAKADDPIDVAKKFRDAQKELAKEW